MTKTAIRVGHLGKRYKIGQRESYKTFRDAITNIAAVPFRRLMQKSNSSNADEYFWALKDVSFEVEPGEVVGIIGRNGTGKSTLLKILSQITSPTSGSVELYGRVSSLLEVGTGFHPELTGRENIYLSGSISGMKRREIDEKFDDIVKFSGVEKFLDTPAKRYSSGMYVRLAFAVAAHLEPEILLVDEVLAVGDAGFQKKCIGKMKEVSGEGRTVLFVSHNINAVEQLCSSCIMLEGGKLKKYGDNVRDIVKEYLFGTEDRPQSSKWVNNGNELNNPWFKVLRFFIGDEKGNQVPMPLSNDSEIWVYIEGYIKEIDPALTIGYAIYSEEGILLYWSYQTDDKEVKWIKLKRDKNVIKSKIPCRFLNEGTYRIEFIGGLHFRQWLFEPGKNAPSIILTIQGGLSDSPNWMLRRPGILAPVMEWNMNDENN
jgi:lipopolysaccharide transport system ATP-binding protein